MKFGQLIECNLRIIFLEKSYTNMVEKLVPDPILKIKFEHISGSVIESFTQFVFIVCQVEGYRNIDHLQLQTTCFYLILSFLFLKKKEVWNQSLCLIFHMLFEEKYFSCYILLIDQVSLSGCLYFVRYWAICVLLLFVNQVVAS